MGIEPFALQTYKSATRSLSLSLSVALKFSAHLKLYCVAGLSHIERLRGKEEGEREGEIIVPPVVRESWSETYKYF